MNLNNIKVSEKTSKLENKNLFNYSVASTVERVHGNGVYNFVYEVNLMFQTQSK